MTVFLVHCWCSRSMPLCPEFLLVESLKPSPHKVEGTQFLSTHCLFFPDEQRAWDLPRDPQAAPLNPYLCLYLGFLLIDSHWLRWPGSVFTSSLLASGNPALKSTFLPSGSTNISQENRQGWILHLPSFKIPGSLSLPSHPICSIWFSASSLSWAPPPHSWLTSDLYNHTPQPVILTG